MDEAKQALNFGRSERAIQAALSMEVQATEIFVEVDHQRFNVQMRLNDNSSP